MQCAPPLRLSHCVATNPASHKNNVGIGRPNVYVRLEQAHVDRKIQTIWDAFASQRDKHWFTKETFLALMRLRGVECKSPSGYAEAFHCRKLVLA